MTSKPEMSGGEMFAWVVVAVFCIGTGMAGYALEWVLHLLVPALVVVGLLAIAVVWLWVYVKHVLPSRRETAQLTAAAPQRQPFPQPQPQQPAIGAGEVHHHYGHSLVLPSDMSLEQIRALRGE